MNPSEIANVLKQRLHVPIAEALGLAARMRVKRFDKNVEVFRQGERSEKVYLLLSGICYVYYSHPDGSEKVKRFVSQGDSLAPYISFLTGEPSKYGARVLHSTNCLEFWYEDYMQLVSKSWALERSHRKELEFQIMEREQKEYELFMMSAKERYQSFVQRHAKIMDNIPLGLIASYINVDPATLSRIRASKK